MVLFASKFSNIKKTTSTTGTSITTTNKDLNKSVDVKKETSFKSSKKLK